MKLIVEKHGEIVKAIKAEYTPTEALIINQAMRRYSNDDEINEDNRTAMEQMLDVKPIFVDVAEKEDDVLNKIKGYVDHIRNTGMGKKKSLEFIEKFIEGLKAESGEE